MPTTQSIQNAPCQYTIEQGVLFLREIDKHSPVDLPIPVRPRGKPTRLELHRLKYNQNGRRGPLLRMSDLTDKEKDIISSEVLKDVRVKRLDFTGDLDEQIFDEVQFGVLSEFGVMCPHSLTEPGFHKFSERCITCGCVMTTIVTGTLKNSGKLTGKVVLE
jgi:hypothetical protein